MMEGMRPQDKQVFAEAAKKFKVWLVVRQTNPASFKYIGLPKYFPKPITCKAKTADTDSFPGGRGGRSRYDTAGLVADPTLHRNAFGGEKAAKAIGIWNNFKSDYLDSRASDYSVDGDPKSRHYGCVCYKGKYLHGDYDLYDIIVTGHENANLAVVGARDGVPDFRTARQFPVEEFVNGRIGAEMVHHGGQFQYSSHTSDVVEIFGPAGESATESAAAWYQKNFPNRKPPGPAGGFAAM